MISRANPIDVTLRRPADPIRPQRRDGRRIARWPSFLARAIAVRFLAAHRECGPHAR
jgi:hypothetical protein